MSQAAPLLNPPTNPAHAVVAFTPVNTVLAQPLSLAIHTTPQALVAIDFVRQQPDQAPTNALAEQVMRQLLAYFDDPQRPFDLPLQPQGTAFQRRLWQALCRLPSGEVGTYGQLARQLESASRAVGQACRRNPIPIVVPCHRVISQAGLGGYGGAVVGDKLRIKQALLAHEGVLFD
jgi:methylated-DNA-[protein]-cysteine S-methyltransferase